ncbi:hypothetical protein [Streptomyces sp. 891-h]|uniref:hypothetical protein n=1 Tax=unclassified Streptomyces TaxID=2593676 RepID=UPI001FA95AC7|nr:hypothetical protein [Streptomyces sp. 891-h]UNZ17036.1 hypothetical protein HC362_08075 [Streptomyces sp. 891-h]
MTAVRPLLLCRWVLGSACAVGWLCAIWRVAVGEGGPVEASVTAGGWGLSVLPVHVAQDLPRREGRGVRGQMQHRMRDFQRLTDPPRR